MAKRIEYIVALGSNVGEREENLARARTSIAAVADILQETEILETWPILIRAQGRFLNQALRVDSALHPPEFLGALQNIERDIGRKRRIKNGPREIDIDIIWCSLGAVNLPDLKIPHPHNRAREWVRRFMFALKGDAIDHEAKLQWRRIQGRSIMNVHDFAKKKAAGEKISIVTCYDHAFARLVARTSIDAILVGDSLGNVVQGNTNTLAVTVDEMIYHARAVRRGAPQAFIVVDMPFMSYQTGVAEALTNAGRIIKETAADAVKLEGGGNILPQVKAIVAAGIPVMGHLGLTPQSVLAFGGYKVQARGDAAQAQLIADAKALEEAGVHAIVLEMIPRELGEKVSTNLTIPTIGIGAGSYTDGQVLVLTDLLGLDPDFTPRFVRKYSELSQAVIASLEHYAADVREQKFPGDKEAFV